MLMRIEVQKDTVQELSKRRHAPRNTDWSILCGLRNALIGNNPWTLDLVYDHFIIFIHISH